MAVRHHVPHDLLALHVLSRLPVKSLRRFVCVSKQWNSTIGDSWFVGVHLDRAKLKPSPYTMQIDVDYNKLLLLEKGSTNNKPLVFQTDAHNRANCKHVYYSHPHETICVCNGLICITRNRDNILILNPSMQELITIQPKDPQDIEHDIKQRNDFPYEFAYLAHPYSANYMGFGFDELRNEYKVVMVFRCLPQRRTCCMVYTLGTSSSSNQWRDITDTCNLPHSLIFKHRPLFSNGTIFWEAMRVQYPEFVRNVVLFDIYTESFLVIEAPQIDIEAIQLDPNYYESAPTTPTTAFDGMVEVGGRPCVMYFRMGLGVTDCHIYIYSLNMLLLLQKEAPCSNQYYWTKENIVLVPNTPIPHGRSYITLAEYSRELLVMWVNLCNLGKNQQHQVVTTPICQVITSPLFCRTHHCGFYHFINHVESILSLRTFALLGASQVTYVPLLGITQKEVSKTRCLSRFFKYVKSFYHKQ